MVRAIHTNMTIMRHASMARRKSTKKSHHHFRYSIVVKPPKYDGEDDEPKEKQWSPEMRRVLLKRNLTAMSLFVSDWKLHSYIVPDPEDGEARVMYLRDLVMFFYVTIIALVMLNLNVGLYLFIYLEGSFVAIEAKRFLLERLFIGLNIWGVVIAPFLFASVLIVALAYHEPKKWTRRKMKIVLLIRYLFIIAILTYMPCVIFYWVQRANDIPSFVSRGVWESFDKYANSRSGVEAAAATAEWEHTQLAFECCGVHSYRDFINTTLEGVGVVQCHKDQTCRISMSPVVVKAYPIICCDTIKNKICVTPPREDQVWPAGCLERTEMWITYVVWMMLGISGFKLFLGVVTTFLFMWIDYCTCREARIGQVNNEGYVDDISEVPVEIPSGMVTKDGKTPPHPSSLAHSHASKVVHFPDK